MTYPTNLLPCYHDIYRIHIGRQRRDILYAISYWVQRGLVHHGSKTEKLSDTKQNKDAGILNSTQGGKRFLELQQRSSKNQRLSYHTSYLRKTRPHRRATRNT